MRGGWGKVSDAASTQFAIDNWHPSLIINIGTCGGIDGEALKGVIILANETIIYDIYVQMGDSLELIKHYPNKIDNSWIKTLFPIPARPYLLISGDRDLFSKENPELKTKYGAIAVDWESGAIAWIAAKNHTRCLVLRGVTDIVSEIGGEAYDGNIELILKNSEFVMRKILVSLPERIIKSLDFEKSKK